MGKNKNRPQGRRSAARIPATATAMLIGLFTLACSGGKGTPIDGFKIVKYWPHDSRAYCQGLLFDGGQFYESTGRRGASTLRRVDPDTGQVQQQAALSPQLFGEGLALIDDRLIQLTWERQRGLVYDRHTFEVLEEFTYAGEGWGLTYDGERLIMSDGSSELRFIDPVTFEEQGALTVRDGENEVSALNELEFIDGEIWANVWKSNRIARIDPDSGEVQRWLDLTDIIDRYHIRDPDDDVLNGIAWDAENERLFVTGKHWPTIFEIEVVRR